LITKEKKGKWNNRFYQLGYAYYKQKDYENAISVNKIIMERFCSANAYYHLGESYLNTDKKQQALNV
jgi:TolA-binding protein